MQLDWKLRVSSVQIFIVRAGVLRLPDCAFRLVKRRVRNVDKALVGVEHDFIDIAELREKV